MKPTSEIYYKKTADKSACDNLNLGDNRPKDRRLFWRLQVPPGNILTIVSFERNIKDIMVPMSLRLTLSWDTAWLRKRWNSNEVMGGLLHKLFYNNNGPKDRQLFWRLGRFPPAPTVSVWPCPLPPVTLYLPPVTLYLTWRETKCTSTVSCVRYS